MSFLSMSMSISIAYLNIHDVICKLFTFLLIIYLKPIYRKPIILAASFICNR